jgi:hypothetical protein
LLIACSARTSMTRGYPISSHGLSVAHVASGVLM